MNERQRDMFLWQWAERRKRGQAAVALSGAIIGALGGIVFAVILFAGMGTGGNASTASVLALLRQGGLLLGLSIPAFAWIGYTGASRVFAGNEMMYQALLKSGARVPDQAPQLRAGDRGPAIAVAVTMLVIVVFIVVLFVKFG